MALVTGKCPRCNATVQLEGNSRVGYCMVCGGRILVTQAVTNYERDQETVGETQKAAPPAKKEDNFLLDAQALLAAHNFEAAGKLFDEIAATTTDNWTAQWGAILAKTHNLTPVAIRDPDEYAYSAASNLFMRGGTNVETEWTSTYWEAFAASCRMSAESIDPRVFLELEIYRWYPHSNTFLYPISKDFDIQPILDKVLWEDWNKLLDALPEDRKTAFKDQCDNCCNRIREYFASGFANMAEIRNGDLSRLMGTWMLKLTTGAQKNDVFHFTQNEAGVPHLESLRTSVNSYDYYRYISVDQSNRVTAGEYRHFPSTTGLGGDFFTLAASEPVLGIMAVYEYILILPTALYSRTEMHKIPNIDRALVYIEKCRTMPCFQRGTNLKNVYQMRPINENHKSAEPSKKMRSCYIATAVYGDIEAPEVERLRRFRDETLNKTRLGRRLCALYYKISPKLAEKLSPDGKVSRFVRRTLDWFVKRLGD